MILVNCSKSSGKTSPIVPIRKVSASVSLGYFKFIVNGLYDKKITKQYSQYGLNVEQNEPDFRNRYSDIPSEKYTYDVMASYQFEIGRAHV